MNRLERWVTAIAIAGLAASVIAVALFSLLLTAPQSAAAVPGASHVGLAGVGQWVLHLVQVVARWL